MRAVMLHSQARCHLCLCLNPDALDHLIPRNVRPDLALSPGNVMPVHSRRCPHCGIGCNSARGQLDVETARRVIQARKAANLAARGIGLDEYGEVELEVHHPVPRQAIYRDGRVFTTVAQAMAELEPTVQNVLWIWSNGNALGCDHGSASSEGRCFDCLPGGRKWDVKVLEFLKAQEAD